jgi:hypothetical protein
MSRRVARVLFGVSLVVVLAVGVALLTRGTSDAPRVSTLGTVAPTTPSTVPSTAPSTTARPPGPTYPVATTVPAPRPPTSISIPSIGVTSDVVSVGLEPGTNQLQIPDIDHVGWYELGPNPGDAGSAVLVGHVDGDGRPGVFWRLGELVPGDIVTVRDATGAHDFRVTGREQVAKSALSADLFSRDGPPRLALITCGGAFDGSSGHYLDNVVVVATPV